jgi:hypothetical protein
LDIGVPVRKHVELFCLCFPTKLVNEQIDPKFEDCEGGTSKRGVARVEAAGLHFPKKSKQQKWTPF